MTDAANMVPYHNVTLLSRGTALCRQVFQKHETPQRYIDGYDPTTSTPPPHCSDEQLLEAYPQVLGTIGAGTGAPTGALALAITGGIYGAGLGSALGPVGTAVGAVGGAALGAVSGWVGGGTVGGAAGVVAGKVLRKLRVQPPFSNPMVQETQGFSLAQLPSHLVHPNYSSQKLLGDDTVTKLLELAQPGDVLVSATDSDTTDFEPIMAALKVGGDWVHTGLYKGDGQVYEMHGSTTEQPHASRSRITPLKTFVERTQHVMLLRPEYKSQADVDNTLAQAQKRLGEKYDFSFNLDRPDKMYCVAYTYLSLKHGAPDVQLAAPDHRLGRDIVTPRTFQDSPDVKEVYSTGADFPMAYWSKFD